MLALSILVVFNSCSGGSDKSSDKGDKEQPSNDKCNGINKVEKFTFNDVDYTFDIKGVSCDLTKGLSYRVILTNYEDWDKSVSKMVEGDVKIILALSSPKDGVFKDGLYTYGNNGDKDNKVALSVYVGTSGNQTFNYANIEDAGFMEISYLDDNQICGKAHLIGQNNSEIIAEFSAQDK